MNPVECHELYKKITGKEKHHYSDSTVAQHLHRQSVLRQHHFLDITCLKKSKNTTEVSISRHLLEGRKAGLSRGVRLHDSGCVRHLLPATRFWLERSKHATLAGFNPEGGPDRTLCSFVGVINPKRLRNPQGFFCLFTTLRIRISRVFSKDWRTTI